MKKSLYWVLGAIALVAAVLIGYALGGSGKDKDAPPAPNPTTVSSVAPSTQAQAAVKIEPSGETGAFLWGPGKTIATSEDITHVHRRMANDPFATGKVDAPVVISEFSDFECPFCAKYANETYPQVLKDYVDKGLVRVEWNDMAVNGPDAVKAAEAGRAAAAQGKFHEFHNALYTASKVTTVEQLNALAGPKLLSFVAQRDITGSELGRLFVKGLNQNSPSELTQRHASDMVRMSDVFSARPKLVPGDTFATRASASSPNTTRSGVTSVIGACKASS